jgi:hypothetical protein
MYRSGAMEVHFFVARVLYIASRYRGSFPRLSTSWRCRAWHSVAAFHGILFIKGTSLLSSAACTTRQ